MFRDPIVYIDDLLLAVEKIINYTNNVNYEEFATDELRFDAIIRNFQVMGEAAKKIPPEIKAQYEEIPWKYITGTRDIIVHEYFSINTLMIWDIAKNKLPLLRDQVRQIKKDIS